MSCKRVRDKLRRGAALSPEEQEHAEQCPACEALVDASPVLPEPEAPTLDLGNLLDDTLAQIEGEKGVRATVRAWPTRRRIAAALGLAALILIPIGVFSPRPPDAEFPITRWAMLLAAFSTVLGGMVFRALRGPDRSEPSVFVLAGAFALAAFIEPLLPEAPSAHAIADGMFITETMKCLMYGVLTGAPVALLVAFMDRRDRHRPYRIWLAGAAGGLTGLSALMLHCRFAEPDHLLAGHSTAALLLAALTSVGLYVADRIRS
ncbi:MAG: hypothetical protein AAFQ82_17880 [Myxococcota bacterium]